MKSLRYVFVGAVLALATISPRDALAQQTGFALDRFEPAERGSQFFVNDTLDLRQGPRPALGLTLDYGYKPLVVYEPNGDERSALVRHQLFAHLGGAVVLADRFRIGVNVPLALYQDGESTRVNGADFKGADKAAIGDVRLAADVRLVGQYKDPFTLAAGLRAWLPSGQQSQFTGDGSLRIGPQALVAGDIGAFTYATRLAVIYRGRDDAYAGSALGSELFGAASVGIKAMDDKLVIGPELFATSVFTDGDAFFKTRGTPVEWLLGAHYDAGPVRLGVGGGSGLTRGYGSPQVRGLFSLEYVAPIERAAPAPVVAPPPPADSDGDGILDREDACPTVPGIRTEDPATNGCPDRDKDAIPDSADACPEVPGVKDVDPKKNGCPPDKDGDGIPDAEDACVDVPGVKDPDPKKNGCPPDTDGDGIRDDVDACPKSPGPPNEDPKKHGCPLVVVTEKEIRINEQVKFKFDSAELLKESDVILGAVKKVLDEYPEIKKVRIEGHTDNVGKPAYNKTLSAKRAASVLAWLTKNGIDKKRLASQGFGQEEPIDSNETDQGRANNRRVAFTILERDESKKKDGAPKPEAPKP